MRTGRLPLVVGCLLLTTLSVAQTPTFNERYDADGTGDQLFGVVATDEGYIGIGNSVNPNTLQTGRLWLFGIDHEGELLWQRTYFPDSVTIQPGWSNSPDRTSDGNFVTPVNEVRPLSGRVMHIMKFNEQGDSLWTCSYECPPGTDYLTYAARETSDGGIVSVGSTDDHFQAPTYRPFAMKCDADGNLLWFRQYSSPTYSTTISSVVATDDGGGIMGGSQRNASNEKMYFLLRFDADGNEVWRKVYDGDVIRTSDAFLARSGIRYYVGSTLRLFGSSTNMLDPYFARISPSTGSLMWELSYPSCEQCHLPAIFGVDTTVEGDLVAGGPVLLPNFEVEALFEYGRLIKVSGEGDLLWERFYAFAEQTNCIFRDLRATEDGGIVAAGHAGNNDEYPSYDGWVIKTDEHGCIVPGCHVGVLENEATAAFKLYPNPARDIVNLYLETDQSRPRGTITIHDLQGREVKNFPAPQGETTYIVDISMLPTGMYVVSYTDGEVRVSEKLKVGR